MTKKINMMGVVGWDFTVGMVRRELRNAAGEDVLLQIESPGGFVSDGLAMYHLIRDYSGKVTARVLGEASSMATVLALAGDALEVHNASVFMIHNPWTFAAGDYKDFEKVGNHLESLAGMLSGIYSDKTGQDRAVHRQQMDDTTFFYGDEIKEAGFADSIRVVARGADSTGEEVPPALSKAAAIDASKAKLKACKELVEGAADYQKDLLKAAAFYAGGDLHKLKTKNTESADTLPVVKLKIQDIEETESMKLKEFLAQNANAQKEHEDLITAAHQKGVTAAREAYDKAAPYLAADSGYPPIVQELALSFVKGDASFESLKTAAAVSDQLIEKQKADIAALESKGLPATPAVSNEKVVDRTKITSSEDLDRLAKCYKGESAK